MTKPLDAISDSWIDKAPPSWRPFLQLSRFDRPIGFWLLGLPCLMGQALGRIGEGFAPFDMFLLALWFVGAIAMRGAGCTINDIVDRDIDAKVERTKNRPLACGAISVMHASIWLVAQLLVGLGVLLALPPFAQVVALLAIPLVIAYPFMKRITWWPQAWLGITFNWGVLVGYAAVTGTISLGAVVFWLGAIFWTLGYDTIYAMSDIEDDALIGVKSTARHFGTNVPMWVAWFYANTTLLFVIATLIESAPISIALAGFPALLMLVSHFRGQYFAINKSSPDCTAVFRSNRTSGLLVVFGLVCIVLTDLWIKSQ